MSEWVFEGDRSRRNMTVWAILKRYAPSYARHMFDDNTVVKAFYESANGGVNPFDMPICKVCNRPGMRVQDPVLIKEPIKIDPVTGEVTDKVNCYCELHGVTYDTKDLRRFLIEDLKLNPEVIIKIEYALLGEMYV